MKRITLNGEEYVDAETFDAVARELDEARSRTPGLLTKEEAAPLMKVQPETVERWAREGRISCVRIGRLLRFRPSDLQMDFDRNAVEVAK